MVIFDSRFLKDTKRRAAEESQEKQPRRKERGHLFGADDLRKMTLRRSR